MAVTASLSAAGTYTAWFPLSALTSNRRFHLSISGTWAGTITIQRSVDGGTTPLDVNTYTANVEDQGDEVESGVMYRAGFKTGQYTSGTAIVRLSQ